MPNVSLQGLAPRKDQGFCYDPNRALPGVVVLESASADEFTSKEVTDLQAAN